MTKRPLSHGNHGGSRSHASYFAKKSRKDRFDRDVADVRGQIRTGYQYPGREPPNHRPCVCDPCARLGLPCRWGILPKQPKNSSGQATYCWACKIRKVVCKLAGMKVTALDPWMAEDEEPNWPEIARMSKIHGGRMRKVGEYDQGVKRRTWDQVVPDGRAKEFVRQRNGTYSAWPTVYKGLFSSRPKSGGSRHTATSSRAHELSSTESEEVCSNGIEDDLSSEDETEQARRSDVALVVRPQQHLANDLVERYRQMPSIEEFETTMKHVMSITTFAQAMVPVMDSFSSALRDTGLGRTYAISGGGNTEELGGNTGGVSSAGREWRGIRGGRQKQNRLRPDVRGKN